MSRTIRGAADFQIEALKKTAADHAVALAGLRAMEDKLKTTPSKTYSQQEIDGIEASIFAKKEELITLRDKISEHIDKLSSVVLKQLKDKTGFLNGEDTQELKEELDTRISKAIKEQQPDGEDTQELKEELDTRISKAIKEQQPGPARRRLRARLDAALDASKDEGKDNLVAGQRERSSSMTSQV